MKIVYAINSIRGLGGIQKVTILKANALADISQNNRHLFHNCINRALMQWL